MDDTISRQAAIDALMPIYKSASLRNRNVFSTAKKCMTTIEELPSAQPENGEWIDYSDEGYVECPFCHSATNCEGNKDELHYCFSCGAELR